MLINKIRVITGLFSLFLLIVRLYEAKHNLNNIIAGISNCLCYCFISLCCRHNREHKKYQEALVTNMNVLPVLYNIFLIFIFIGNLRAKPIPKDSVDIYMR